MKKLISTITVIFTFLFVLIALEARADLVDDLIKKHKLDPKNSLQDHCELMVQLDYKISRNTKGDQRCFENFCNSPRQYYFLTKEGWKKDSFWIIYKLNPLKIIGRVIADDIVYESYDTQKSYIEQPTYFLERKIDGIKNEDLKNSNEYYVKTRGCRIEETNLNVKNLTK